VKKFALLSAFALVAGFACVAFAEESKSEATLTVAESAVCTGISDRQPDGTASEFSKDVPKIYYWTRINGASGEEQVKHVWYVGETAVAEIPLTIKSSSFRTWSAQTVYPGFEGDLSVAVVDAAGNVLKKDTFTIK